MGLEPKVYNNFISEDERLELLKHALSLKMKVNDIEAPYGTRTFKRIDNTMSYTDIVDMMFHRIVDKLNLTNPIVDPLLGQIVSIITPGGYVHSHTDDYRTDSLRQYNNLRFNIMVDRGADISYNPIIEGRVYYVNKCDAWCFGASKYRHKTAIISGPENRVVYQFGFLV